MRRIFIMLTLICAFAIGANAQIVRSTTSEIKKVKVVKPEKPWHHSGFFIDGGIGVLTNGGDLSVDSEGDFAFQAGLGYRWLIGGGVSWEVFRIGYNAGVSDMAASG